MPCRTFNSTSTAFVFIQGEREERGRRDGGEREGGEERREVRGVRCSFNCFLNQV